MVNAAHTPGPWSVHKSRTTDDVGIMGDKGCLAECFSEIRKAGEKAYGEQMANALLIAAAPTMAEYVRSKADDGCPVAKSIMEAINANA